MAFEFLSLFIPVMHIAWGNFKSIKLINQNNFKSPILKSLHIMYFSLFFLLKFEFNLCIWDLSEKLLYFLKYLLTKVIIQTFMSKEKSKGEYY